MSRLQRRAAFAGRLRRAPLVRVLSLVAGASLLDAAWRGWGETQTARWLVSGFAGSFPVYRHGGIWQTEQGGPDDVRGSVKGDLTWEYRGRYHAYLKVITLSTPVLEVQSAVPAGSPPPTEAEAMAAWREAASKNMKLPGPEWMAAAAPGRTVEFGFDGWAKAREFVAQTAATGAPFSLTMLSAAAMVAVVGLRRLTRGWVREAGECLRCGYDLRAAPGAVCPECGAGREG